MVSSEELECGCCYELLLNPTTLTCGHSFCRYCLAKWFKMSKKTECPECRQNWTGFPQINIRLRSIIEKSFPEQVKVRMKSQKSMPDYKKVLKQFEEHGERIGDQSESLSAEQVKMLVVGAFLVIGVLLIVLLIGIFYWMFFAEARPSEVIYSRSVRKWSIREVVSWAQAFSDQFGHDYSEGFKKAGIDGYLLLSLNDEDLVSPPLNISTTLHRKIILAEIMKLDAAGVKQPNDLWEYKNAHRISATFMLFMLQDFPRLTIFYHRYMDHDTVWLPFVQTVIAKPQCKQVESHDDDYDDDYSDAGGQSKCSASEEEITSSDKMWFYAKVMLFPYYLISQFAWHYIDVHFITMWIIISHCVMLTFRELLQLNKVNMFNISLTTLQSSAFDATLSFLVSCVLYRIVVLFIPAIILDFVFFAKLYYGPLDTAGSIRNGHLRTNAIGKVLNVVFAAVDKVLVFIRFLFNRRGRHA